MGTVPPKTERFCVACERVTKWSYNRNISHSQCCKCGGQYGTDPDSYFTTVYKQKSKAEHKLCKVQKNYITLLEMFLSEEEQFSKKFKKKVRRLYNPNLDTEDEKNELQSRQEEETNNIRDREAEGKHDVSRVY